MATTLSGVRTDHLLATPVLPPELKTLLSDAAQNGVRENTPVSQAEYRRSFRW